MPKSRTSCTRQSSVTERIVDEAVMLRCEVPTRSIRQIIQILKLEGVAVPNEIKRSTLQDQLQKSCFITAIEHNGRSSRIFTDNGSQYVSRHLNQVCAKLGIKHLRARPMAGQAKGKVEAFNKYLDRFVSEVNLKDHRVQLKLSII